MSGSFTIALALLLCALGHDAPPHLLVDLVFAGVSLTPRIEAEALTEVTAIWAAYNVDIRRAQPDDTAREGAIRLAVVLADRPDGGVSAGALGSISFVDGTPEPAIVMYPLTIAALVSVVRVEGKPIEQRPFALRERFLGRAFGRALAHELGHFLLRSREHSASGLMRASPPVTDFVDPDRHRFVLSAEETTRLTAAGPLATQ